MATVKYLNQPLQGQCIIQGFRYQGPVAQFKISVAVLNPVSGLDVMGSWPEPIINLPSAPNQIIVPAGLVIPLVPLVTSNLQPGMSLPGKILFTNTQTGQQLGWFDMGLVYTLMSFNTGGGGGIVVGGKYGGLLPPGSGWVITNVFAAGYQIGDQSVRFSLEFNDLPIGGEYFDIHINAAVHQVTRTFFQQAVDLIVGRYDFQPGGTAFPNSVWVVALNGSGQQIDQTPDYDFYLP